MMDYLPGKFFYHYTKREIAFEHILPTRKLRLSPYSRMKDPLENKVWQFVGGHWISFADDLAVLERKEEVLDQFERGAYLIWRSVKLLALTIDAQEGYAGHAKPFGMGWSRARMWEHHAEEHAGVCLVFDQDKLNESIKKSVIG